MEQSADILQSTLHPSGILQLTLNRPSALNALNADLVAALHQQFALAKSNSNVKAILLTGTGKAFCAGADIHQLATLNGQMGHQFSTYGQQIFRLLEQLGKPSLAAINGFALGGGCELAMAATLRIASTQAVFGQPEVKLGVIPGFGGTQRLSRLVGKGRALELCLTGRTFKAEDALQWGLVTEVVAPDVLIPHALALLESITPLAPAALKSIITTIDMGFDLPLDSAMELEAVHFGLCCATRDKQEGVAAFLEKRAAVFSGE